MIANKKLLTTAMLGTIALFSFFSNISNLEAGESQVNWGLEDADKTRESGKLNPEFISVQTRHHFTNLFPF